MKVLKNQKGFTLIELIIIIIILGILAAVAVPKYADLQKQAARGVAQGFLGAARGANVIQYSTMLLNNQTGSYTWSNILGNMDYQGITVTAPGGNTITINVSGYEFQFSMNPLPNIPTTYAGIVTTGTNW